MTLSAVRSGVPAALQLNLKHWNLHRRETKIGSGNGEFDISGLFYSETNAS